MWKCNYLEAAHVWMHSVCKGHQMTVYKMLTWLESKALHLSKLVQNQTPILLHKNTKCPNLYTNDPRNFRDSIVNWMKCKETFVLTVAFDFWVLRCCMYCSNFKANWRSFLASYYCTYFVKWRGYLISLACITTYARLVIYGFLFLSLNAD